MSEYRFRLSISAEEYISYYQGSARQVLVKLEDGRKLQFPAVNLRTHITHEGIYGLFELRVDENNKLRKLERIGD